MTIDQKTYALIQHIQALELTKKSLEERKARLEETLKKIEDYKDRRFYLNLFGVLLVESNYEEAKKAIEEELMLLESRISKLEKQLSELKSKIGLA